jgi:photosystem II stability/assembly factor-like uncharacterized protein
MACLSIRRLTRVVLSFLTLALPTANSFAQWEIVGDTLEEGFLAVDFYDDNFGVAAGRGSLYKSEDGGVSWTVSDTSAFAGISFFDVVIDSTIAGPVAVAVGSELTIVRSADRAESWRDVHHSVNSPLYGTCFLGDGRFAAFGGGGWLAKSSDTGLSWETGLIFPAADMNGSWCQPDGTLWVAGFANNGSVNQCCGVLLKSDDQGESWTKVLELTDTRDGHFSDVVFASDDVGIALSDASRFTPRTYLWKTTDGGATWERLGQFLATINAIDLYDENIGAMVGDEGLILWTEDGGETWVEHPNPSPLNLYDVFLFDAQTAVAVGDVFILRNTTGALVANEPHELPASEPSHWAYPNPAVSSLSITISDPSPSAPELRITDVIGRSIAVRNSVSSNGSVHEFRLELDDLPGGVYFYSLRGESTPVAGSFVVAR